MESRRAEELEPGGRATMVASDNCRISALAESVPQAFSSELQMKLVEGRGLLSQGYHEPEAKVQKQQSFLKSRNCNVRNLHQQIALQHPIEAIDH
jgi:hypothetical protein